MSTITRIDWTFNSDSCGDNETAGTFAAWAEAELQRRYPTARVDVTADDRTSGHEQPARVDCDSDDYADEAQAEDAVREEISRLWEQWERAGWPGAAA